MLLLSYLLNTSHINRYYSLQKAYKEKVMIMHVDRHWHPFRVATRNGKCHEHFLFPLCSVSFTNFMSLISFLNSQTKLAFGTL
jgi:hypothetical protein